MNHPRISNYLFLGLLATGCGCGDRVRHLVCYDETGAVVVDTTDVREAPRQSETAWHWWSKDYTAFHQLSIPPHKCVYESHAVETEPSSQESKNTTLLAEAPG